jgi:hypothetical protein
MSMHGNNHVINDGLLRLHAKLTAISEIVWASSANGGLTIGSNASFGLHCLLSEMSDEVQRLKDMNEKWETA